MIELQPFLAEMALLSERFGRQPSEVLALRYQQELEDILSTEQFQLAAKIIFTRDSWFPSPERFIEAAFGDLNDLASAQWLEMLAASKEDRRSNIDAVAKEAMKELGGTDTVRNLRDIDQLMRVRKEFTESYVRRVRAARINAPALPAPTPAKLKAEPNPDPDRFTEEEWRDLQSRAEAGEFA